MRWPAWDWRDSFNMVIMAFLLLSILVLLSLWHLVSVRGIVTTSEGGDAQSLVIMTLFAVLLATLIHHFGEQIIDFVAGDATTEVKALALTYLELTVPVIQQLPSLLLVAGTSWCREYENTAID